MAEVVEKFIDEIYEDYSLFKKTDLFQLDELRSLVKRHHALIYKAARRQKRPDDYLALLQFEVQLYRLIRRRRQTTGYVFRPGIERRLVERMQRLHRVLCYRFPDVVAHWVGHLTLLRHVGHYKAIDRLLERLLQQHPHEAELWSVVGRWHLHERPRLRMERRRMAQRRRRRRQGRPEAATGPYSDPKDSEEEDDDDEEEEGELRVRVATMADGVARARRLFHSGLKANPGSGRLLADYFAFELDAADWARWRDALGLSPELRGPGAGEPSPEAVTDGRLAALVWETVRSKFGTRLPVVEQCAAAVERVGWLAADGWAAEVLRLRDSLLAAAPRVAPARPSTALRPAAHSDPVLQVDAFETALAAEGSAGARRVWAEAARQGWPTVELFLRWAALEAAQSDAAERQEEIRRHCERMAALRGADSADVWLTFIRFESRWAPAHVGLLDWRARRALSGAGLAAFVARRAAAVLMH